MAHLANEINHPAICSIAAGYRGIVVIKYRPSTRGGGRFPERMELCLFGRGHVTAGRSGRSWIWLGGAGGEGGSGEGENDELHGSDIFCDGFEIRPLAG